MNILICHTRTISQGEHHGRKNKCHANFRPEKIKYTAHSYADTDALSGMEVATALSQNPDAVFKTLVTIGKSANHYVFLVPVNQELDLKKAAKSVGEKASK